MDLTELASQDELEAWFVFKLKQSREESKKPFDKAIYDLVILIVSRKFLGVGCATTDAQADTAAEFEAAVEAYISAVTDDLLERISNQRDAAEDGE